MLFLDIMRNNLDAQVTIDALASTNGVFIKGFIMEDFQFGGRNSFTSAMEAIMGAMNQINSDIRTATTVANRLGGQSIAGRTLAAGDSVSAWVSSDRPKFSIPLLFVAANALDDPRAVARDLLNFVYPSGNPNTIMTAPLGYTASFGAIGTGVPGCASISIGRWFRAPRVFVVKQLMMTVSQRTDPNGVPLYVGAVIEFEAYRTFTVEEVRSWFLGG